MAEYIDREVEIRGYVAMASAINVKQTKSHILIGHSCRKENDYG